MEWTSMMGMEENKGRPINDINNMSYSFWEPSFLPFTYWNKEDLKTPFSSLSLHHSLNEQLLLRILIKSFCETQNLSLPPKKSNTLYTSQYNRLCEKEVEMSRTCHWIKSCTLEVYSQSKTEILNHLKARKQRSKRQTWVVIFIS